MIVLQLIGAGVWVGALVLALCVVTVAKRADEAMAREGLPSESSLAAVAAEVQRALGAERVTVVVADPYQPATGKVGASWVRPSSSGAASAWPRRRARAWCARSRPSTWDWPTPTSARQRGRSRTCRSPATATSRAR